MPDGNPFDDIRALIEKMPPPNTEARQAVSGVLARVDGPRKPIGDTDVVVTWLAGWQGTAAPAVNRPLIAVFAGSHAAASHVNNDDAITRAKERVQNVSEGAAGVRGMAASMQAAFKVFEMGLEYPAADFTQEASLSARDSAAAIAFGMEVVAEGADIIVLGNAGYGSATAAAAMARALYGGSAEYWSSGYGKTSKLRVAAVEAGAVRHKDALGDPLEILRRFGGRDIAGMVGAILAARHQSIPIVLDGFVVCIAAAVLHAINPAAIDHCIAGHLSSEPGHRALLDRLDMEPLLSLGIGLGDGSGGVLALGVIRSVCAAVETLSLA